MNSIIKDIVIIYVVLNVTQSKKKQIKNIVFMYYLGYVIAVNI